MRCLRWVYIWKEIRLTANHLLGLFLLAWHSILSPSYADVKDSNPMGHQSRVG